MHIYNQTNEVFSISFLKIFIDTVQHAVITLNDRFPILEKIHLKALIKDTLLECVLHKMDVWIHTVA